MPYKGGSRLAAKFRLWFLLTLLLPFGFLIYFSRVSLADRRILIGETLRENQLSQVLSIEEFFRNRFAADNLVAQKDILVDLEQAYDQKLKKFPLHSQRLELAQSLTHIFHHEFFPKMGFKIPMNKEEKVGDNYVNQLFCKFQIADLRTFNDGSSERYSSELEKIRDFYDLVGSSATRLLDNPDLKSKHFGSPGCSSTNALKADPKTIDPHCLNHLMALEIRRLKLNVERREELLYERQGDFLLDTEELKQIFRPLKFLDTQSKISVDEFQKYHREYQSRIQRLMHDARQAYEKALHQKDSEQHEIHMERGSSEELEAYLKTLESLAHETFSDVWLRGENWDQLGRPPTYFIKELEHRVFSDEWELIFTNSFSLVDFRFDLLEHFKRQSSTFALEIGNSFMTPQLLLEGFRPLMSPGDIDWRLVVRLLLHLIKFSLSGDFYLDEQSSIGATAIVRTTDLKRTRNNKLAIAVALGKISFLWDLIPRTYIVDDFVTGIAPPPRALLALLIREHEFTFHYVRLFQAISSLNVSDPKLFFPALDDAYSKLQLDGEDLVAGFGNSHEVLRLMIEEMNRRWGGKARQIDFPSFRDFFLYEIGLNARYTVDRKDSWQANTRIQILPTQKVYQANLIKNEDFADQKIQTEVGRSFSSEKINKWLEEPGEVLSFEYRDIKGQDRFATLVNSADLPGFVFFLSIDSATAFCEIDYVIILLIGISAMAIFISLGLGATISKIVVRPVNMLREEVQMYGGGISREPLIFKRSDELGKMISLFNAMVESINQRVSELKAVSEVNTLLLRGKKLTELLTFVGQRFTQLTGAKIGFIGFLDQDSSERLLASYLHGIEQGEAHDILKQELLEIGAQSLEDTASTDLLHQLSSYGQLSVPSNTLHFQSIQPALRGLSELREVLKDIGEDEGEHGDKPEIQLKGFILLMDCDEPLLSEEKLEFLKEFGNQAATVILKAYLDQTRDETIEGQMVQESLMPTEAPGGQDKLDVASSFVAAKYLGGDFFDFLSPGSGGVGFFIADVSGKGIGPALFGATSKAYLKLLSANSPDTGTTLSKMNDYLCQLGYEHLFATAFYISIHPDTLEAEYSSAGHNRMLLIRHDSQDIEYLNAKGLVLGMFTPCRFETKALTLNRGDLLVLYTDGITELENPELELYGLERFESTLLKNRALDSESLKAAVLEDLQDYGRSQIQSDDITLVIVKIRL